MITMVSCRIQSTRKRPPNPTPGKYRARRIVAALEGTFSRSNLSATDSLSLPEQLAIEADTTRWWLQEHNLWLGSDLAEKVRVFIDETDATKEIFVYPIFDDPDLPESQLVASYYIGFDAKIYLMAEDGNEPINADDPAMRPEVEYIIEQLRHMRHE